MTVPSTFSQGSTEIRERLSQQDIQHVGKLRCLKNPELVPILRDEFCRSFRWIVSIKIRPSILQETPFCRFITKEILLYFCSFEILNTQINIFNINCAGFCSKMFSISMDAMTSRRGAASSIVLSGVQKSVSEYCKSKQMEWSFSGAIFKIYICMHSKAVEPLSERRKSSRIFSEFFRVTIVNIITLDHLFVRSHVPTVHMALSKSTLFEESVRRNT